jgi:hypothetical protein
VASNLLAQRDLLELKEAEAEAAALHARAWARLEAIVGRHVARQGEPVGGARGSEPETETATATGAETP